jgi:hypothetical protein
MLNHRRLNSLSPNSVRRRRPLHNSSSDLRISGNRMRTSSRTSVRRIRSGNNRSRRSNSRSRNLSVRSSHHHHHRSNSSPASVRRILNGSSKGKGRGRSNRCPSVHRILNGSSSLNAAGRSLSNRNNIRSVRSETIGLLRSDLSNKLGAGSSRRAGRGTAPGRGTIALSTIAPATGRPSTVPGHSAEDTADSTFRGRPSASTSGLSITSG